MRHFTINLKDEFPALDTEQEPRLVAYIPDNFQGIDADRQHPAVLICPGGAYMVVADREAEPIALSYVARGFAAFVLYYTVRPLTYPRALREAGAAMALIRRRAREWTIDPDCIAVGGFSAGGHLAGSLGTKWHEDEIFAGLHTDAEERKPNGLLLCYAVMCGHKPDGEPISIETVSGESEPSQETFRLHDLPAHVTEKTPPAFLWHTADDPIVPVTGAMKFAQQLRYHGIGFEMHVYSHGSHGLSTCNTASIRKDNTDLLRPECEDWISRSIQWLLQLFSHSSL